MNKIDLKAILAKHSTNYSLGLSIGKESNSMLSGKEALAGLEEVWNMAVDKYYSIQSNKYLAGETGYLTTVDIEDLKQIIL